MKKYLIVLAFILLESGCSLSQKRDTSKALGDTISFGVKVTESLLKKLKYEDSQDEEKMILLKMKGVKVASGTNLRVFVFLANQKNRDFSVKSPNYLTSLSLSPHLYQQTEEAFELEVKKILKRMSLKKDDDLSIVVIPITTNKSAKDTIHLKVNTMELY
jgi:Protein of unknown function (DUF_B2219)